MRALTIVVQIILGAVGLSILIFFAVPFIRAARETWTNPLLTAAREELRRQRRWRALEKEREISRRIDRW